MEPFHCAQFPASTTAMHIVGVPQDSTASSAGNAVGRRLIAVRAVPAYCRYRPSDDSSMHGPPGAQETLGPRFHESVRVAIGAHQLVPLKREARPSASSARQRVGPAHERSAAASGMVLAALHEPLVQTR